MSMEIDILPELELEDFQDVSLDEVISVLEGVRWMSFEPNCTTIREVISGYEFGNYSDEKIQNISQMAISVMLIEPRLNPLEPCPLGYICEGIRQANCTKIRNVVSGYLFGDIHAGAYCPLGSDGIMNCPAGHYCPTAEIILECPEGYFCPHKTAIPDIVCKGCKAGDEVLSRATDELMVFAGICGIMFLIFLGANQRKSALIRLKPTLYRIQQRLEATLQERKNQGNKLSGKGPSIDFCGTRIHDSETIVYDPKRLFDFLDVDRDGSISIEDLQIALELRPEQLYEFTRRMNQLSPGRGDDDSKISRPCFTKYFLQVLGEIAYFGSTPKEVEELFMEISAGEAIVPYTSLYDSQISLFLTDPQINQLITLFRNIGEKEDRLRRSKARRSSFFFSKLRDDDGDGLRAMEKAVVRPSLSVETQTMRNNEGNEERPLRRSSRSSTRTRMSIFENPKRDNLHLEDFVEHYAAFLVQVTESKESSQDDSAVVDGEVTSCGVDLTFEDLCLKVRVGGKEINVVNNVSGRLQAATMTALMGGSGAGKTSLLNALCGRAYYGTTTGTVRINGQVAVIEDHTDAIGFVPQSDDSVRADLTVKENLVYSGRFSMPKGTPLSEIEEHADEVLASLGLSRVANSLVGDENRQSVSGGEKKRVNIGVELMSKPSILFLDEPTSGLDSSSALLVMNSLKNLVKLSQMTICAAIHQPRMQIFESFDSLLLLGVGGNTVYHGPIQEAHSYFKQLKTPYILPPGESLADLLIDISSGRLGPSEIPESQSGEDDSMLVDSVTRDESESGAELEKPMHTASSILDEDEKHIDNGTHSTSIFKGDGSPSTFHGLVESEEDRRRTLYEGWICSFRALPDEARRRFIPPDQYDLPKSIVKPSFSTQLRTHLGRNFLGMWRNRSSIMIDTIVVVGGVIGASIMEGVMEVTVDWTPNLTFDQLVNGDPFTMPYSFPELFMHATMSIVKNAQFLLKIAMIVCLPIGLSMAKMITFQRLQFFREAGSGIDINAYFLALNITSTIEHFVQVIAASFCTCWIRGSLISRWYAYQIHFLMLMWLLVSWTLFIPLVVPQSSVTMLVGFFIVLFGMLFSGVLIPFMTEQLYSNDGLGLFCGIMSISRFFLEGLTVQELRYLPEQSGFTVQPTSVYFPYHLVGSFELTGLAENDLSVIQRSRDGWYWGVPPAFFVGLFVRWLALGALHACDRSRQNKKSLWFELRKEPLYRNRRFYYIFGYLVVAATLFWACAKFTLSVTGETGIGPIPEDLTILANQTLDGICPIDESVP